MPSSGPRYKVDHGRLCIELNLKHVNQLFETLDPSPFLDRDLDADAADYIVAATMEHPLGTSILLRIHVADMGEPPIEPATVIDAIHNHFKYNSDLVRKKLRRTFREGQFAFWLGVSVLSICLVMAQSLSFLSQPGLSRILREGLTILGWVAMWKPIDMFLYSWRPQVEMRRVYAKLSKVPVDIKIGESKKHY